MTTRTILNFGDAPAAGTRHAGGPFNGLNLDEWGTIYWPLSDLLPFRDVTSQYLDQINRRRNELFDWLKVGRTLIVILNRSGTNYLAGLGPLLPSPVALVASDGTKVKAVGPSKLSEVIAPFVSKIQYHQVFDPKKGTPFLAMDVAQTTKPVVIGAIFNVEKGHVVIAPPINEPGFVEQYLSALEMAPRLLEPSPTVIPKWTEKYQFQSEVSDWKEIEKHDHAIAQHNAKRSAAVTRIELAQTTKRLISTSGTDLHDAVAAALTEIGFQVVKVPGKRTDILARDGARLFAIEVKGLDNKSARAEDMGQVTRWLSDVNTVLVASQETIDDDPHLAQLSEALKNIGVSDKDRPSFKCKPALIVEAYRSVPLQDRTNPAFPTDLEHELRRVGICALTGTQLLGLVVMAQQEGSDKAAIRDQFFETNGEMKTAGWDTFLSLVK